jgi:hypothetical protein
MLVAFAEVWILCRQIFFVLPKSGKAAGVYFTSGENQDSVMSVCPSRHFSWDLNKNKRRTDSPKIRGLRSALCDIMVVKIRLSPCLRSRNFAINPTQAESRRVEVAEG